MSVRHNIIFDLLIVLVKERRALRRAATRGIGGREGLVCLPRAVRHSRKELGEMDVNSEKCFDTVRYPQSTSLEVFGLTLASTSVSNFGCSEKSCPTLVVERANERQDRLVSVFDPPGLMDGQRAAA